MKSVFIIVVEHDLSVLDYLSDQVCLLYGTRGAYGVVSSPFSVREGINHFLEGYLPTENLRFRDSKIDFKLGDAGMEIDKDSLKNHYEYPEMTKTLGEFTLRVEGGSFSDSEIIVLLGENGTGKSTLIKLLAGSLAPDDNAEIPQLRVSYKPQAVPSDHQGSVRSLLHKEIRGSYTSASFVAEVLRPLLIEPLLDRDVPTLSGGELQRVALALCLGRPAQLYLIDEPSAYLDSEQRLVASKVIKRFVLGGKRTAFVVEHDFIMATYLADRIVVYEGEPGVAATALAARGLEEGMNRFLRGLGITLRRDPSNFRPRVNKLGSQKDQEQKRTGRYFARAERK